MSNQLGVSDDSRTLFFVICRSRTGSNLLIDCLHQHPGIRVWGEIFKNQKITTQELISTWKKSSEKVLGCKLFYYHSKNGAGDVWTFLDQNPNVKFIHLTRKDKVRTIISQAIATHTKVWKQKWPLSLPLFFKRISIDRNWLATELEKTENWEREFRNRYKDRSILEICYEDLVADPGKSLDNCFDFLGLKHVNIQIRLHQQNPEKIETLVKNWAEIEPFCRRKQ